MREEVIALGYKVASATDAINCPPYPPPVAVKPGSSRGNGEGHLCEGSLCCFEASRYRYRRPQRQPSGWVMVIDENFHPGPDDLRWVGSIVFLEGIW